MAHPWLASVVATGGTLSKEGSTSHSSLPEGYLTRSEDSSSAPIVKVEATGYLWPHSRHILTIAVLAAPT